MLGSSGKTSSPTPCSFPEVTASRRAFSSIRPPLRRQTGSRVRLTWQYSPRRCPASWRQTGICQRGSWSLQTSIVSGTTSTNLPGCAATRCPPRPTALPSLPCIPSRSQSAPGRASICCGRVRAFPNPKPSSERRLFLCRPCRRYRWFSVLDPLPMVNSSSIPSFDRLPRPWQTDAWRR